jgi:hypothetical protein
LILLRSLLCLALAVWLAFPARADVTGTAQALTGTAMADEGPAPARPQLGKLKKNDRAEDFLIITTISLPFTALYTIAAVALVDSIHQQAFPPEIDDRTWVATGIVAAAGALTIATVSVKW